MVGQHEGTTEFGDGSPAVSAGAQDAYVAVYGPGCDLLWKGSFGGPMQEVAMAAAFDASGALVVDFFVQSSIDVGLGTHAAPNPNGSQRLLVVARFDADYQPTFSKAFGPQGGPVARDLAVDASGHSYLVGHFFDTVSFGEGTTPLMEPTLGTYGAATFMVRLDPSGQHVFSTTFPTSPPVSTAGFHDLVGIDVDRDGTTVLLNGMVPSGETTIDLGGGLLSTSTSGTFIAALTVDGEHLWSRTFPAPWMTAALTPDHDAMLMARLGGGGVVDWGLGPEVGDLGIARLDGVDGQAVWTLSFAQATGESIAATAPGGTVVTGSILAPTDFGGGELPMASDDVRDQFVARFDARGAHLHSFPIRAEGNQEIARVGSGPTGETVLVGTFQGQVAIGELVLPDAGAAEDVFAAVFSK